jgi:hypothetical protein
MTLGETLIEVWRQVLVEGKPRVESQGKSYPVATTRAKTDSRWALLAREGKRVMQFTFGRRYIANVSEGELVRYPAWHSLGLPE